MKKIYAIFAALMALLFLSGCEDKKIKLITFHVANPREVSYGISRTQLTMPASGFSLAVSNDQFMYSGDLTEVKPAQITLPDGKKEVGFLFIGDQRGALRLYHVTGGNLGGYIVVRYDGQPIAVRKIDCAISDGVLFAVSELPEGEDMFKYIEDMNRDIKDINEYKLKIK